MLYDADENNVISLSSVLLRCPSGHPDIIKQAIWLYFRFTMNYRDVEELLAARGIDVSYDPEGSAEQQNRAPMDPKVRSRICPAHQETQAPTPLRKRQVDRNQLNIKILTEKSDSPNFRAGFMWKNHCYMQACS